MFLIKRSSAKSDNELKFGKSTFRNKTSKSVTKKSSKSIFLNPYQKKLFEHKKVIFKNKILDKANLDKNDSLEDEVIQESRTLRIELNVPKNGIGGGPRFLVQFESQNHVFLDENEKVRSHLSNTLHSLLKIDHSLGRDFKYFHTESLVKAFLPLKLVSNLQIQNLNKEKIEKFKKEYAKKAKKLAPIKEESRAEVTRVENQKNSGWIEKNWMESKSSLGQDLPQQISSKKRIPSLNSSLRSETLLVESSNFDRNRKRRAYRSLKNDHLQLGYKGGNQQFVRE